MELPTAFSYNDTKNFYFESTLTELSAFSIAGEVREFPFLLLLILIAGSSSILALFFISRAQRLKPFWWRMRVRFGRKPY
jgi:hypothetical protein